MVFSTLALSLTRQLVTDPGVRIVATIAYGCWFVTYVPLPGTDCVVTANPTGFVYKRRSKSAPGVKAEEKCGTSE